MSKINEYFKTVKSTDCNVRREQQILENSETRSFATQFYEGCFEKQFHECTKSDCIRIKATLEIQLKNLEQKCENIEEAIKIGSEIVTEKNNEIEYLLKQVEVVRKKNVVSAIASDQSEEPSSTQKSTEVSGRKMVPANTVVSNSTRNLPKDHHEMFGSYENDFNKETLSYLRSLDPRKENDSHFINTVVKSLYDGRLNILSKKSVTGRSKPGQTKEAVSPNKHDTLKRIFTERILTATADDAERGARKKKLNRFINDAIHNITKSIESKDLEKEACQRLADNLNE